MIMIIEGKKAGRGREWTVVRVIEERLDELRIGITFQVQVQQLTAVRVPVGRNQAGPSLTIDLTTAEQSMHFLGTLSLYR
jgi:hypothetical protein